MLTKRTFIENKKGLKIKGFNIFEDFDGLLVTEFDKPIKVLNIKFKSGLWIECTEDHAIYTSKNKYVLAKDIIIGDIVLGINGTEIVSEIEVQMTNKIYNVVRVTNHRFYVNGILTHNCDEFAFVPQNQCLAGDGIIHIRDNNIEKTITLEELYEKFIND